MRTREKKIHYVPDADPGTEFISACRLHIPALSRWRTSIQDRVTCRTCLKVLKSRKARQLRQEDSVLKGLERLKRQFISYRDFKNVGILTEAISRLEAFENERKTWGKPDPSIFGYNKLPEQPKPQPKTLTSQTLVPENVNLVNWNRLVRIIIEQLSVKRTEVKADARIIDDLGADSLDTVEVVMALEEEFEIEITDEEAESVKTVKEAYDLVQKKLGEPK